MLKAWLREPLVHFLVLGALLFAVSYWCGGSGSEASEPAQAAPDGGERDLSSQATDPTASLMAFNFINDFRLSYWGLDDSGYEFRFQPAIPFRAWKTNNILRVIVPYQGSGPQRGGAEERLDLRSCRASAEVGAARMVP